MNKPRRIIAATELRVHLGEALRALEREELVIEKGGIPVALLTKYRSESEAQSALETEYERSLSKRAEPGGWERMDAAMAAGWVGIDADELVANIYRRREENPSRFYSWDGEDAMAEEDDSEVSARQRRLRPRSPTTKRIADEGGPGYQA